MTRKWKIVYRTPGYSQRYAIEDDPYKAPELRELYVFDNSGGNPDRTDDGPQRVRLDAPLVLSEDGGTFHMSVWDERNDRPAFVMDDSEGLFGLLRALRDPEVLGEGALKVRAILGPKAKLPARAIMRLLELPGEWLEVAK